MSPRCAPGYLQALCCHRGEGRHSQAEQGRLLLAQPGTELPGFTAAARLVPSTHNSVSVFPLRVVDALQTHPTKKQLSGLRANLGQGADGKPHAVLSLGMQV